MTIRLATGARPARGPSGKWIPPRTPAYSTPATAYASTATQLLAALDAHDGTMNKVIEVTAPLGNLGTIAPRNGAVPSSQWVYNVLVRPPLGQRLPIGTFSLACQHVTMAGFDFTTPGERQLRGNANSTITSETSPGAFSAFWRIVDAVDPLLEAAPVGGTNTAKWFIGRTYRAGFYECAAPYFNPKGLADRLAVYSQATGGHVLSPSIIGCWFNDVDQDYVVAPYSDVHVDVMQIESPVFGAGNTFAVGQGYVRNPTVAHSVIGASGNAALITKNCEGDLLILNNWFGYRANFTALGLSPIDEKPLHSVDAATETVRNHLLDNDFVFVPRIYSGKQDTITTAIGNRFGLQTMILESQVTSAPYSPQSSVYYRRSIEPLGTENEWDVPVAKLPKPPLRMDATVWPECPSPLVNREATYQAGSAP